MKLTVKQLTLLNFLLILSSVYILFAIYFFEQRDKTAHVIWKNIKNDLNELSYVLSKNIALSTEVASSRALLDRKAANSDYINAIAVFDDEKLIITTDPIFSTYDPTEETHIINVHKNSSEALSHHNTIIDHIYYYKGEKRENYDLVFLLDQEYIKSYFAQSKTDFLIWFFLFPFLLFLVSWSVLRALIDNPLERLRQFAYYQSEVPKKFFLRELESIRYSMVQSFKRLEEEKKDLFTLARTDTLSGLANRYYLEEQFEHILASSQRRDGEFALLFLDLDYFKIVNDSLGHDIGDELLKKISAVIREVLRINDVVARIGGDEFVIIITEYMNEVQLVEIVQRIQTRINIPRNIRGNTVQVSSSIGISLYPKDGKNLVDLMKYADIAMYKAKENGRSQYNFFTQDLNEKIQSTIDIGNRMKRGLDNAEFELYLQPQVNIDDGSIIGAETLIRWNDPARGLVYPSSFIMLAEQNGFIIPLGDWIIDEALRQKKDLENNGINIKLSINIAARQFVKDNFIEKLFKALDKHSIDESKIVLEITETIFLEKSTKIIELFNKLKSRGILISLDDFGTGYSSLSYLKSFPIDILKIDKAFVDDYHSNRGINFLETIIKMGQTLNLEVIAEGVEEDDQLALLKSLRCNSFQGFLCSKPLPMADFKSFFLSSNKCR